MTKHHNIHECIMKPGQMGEKWGESRFTFSLAANDAPIVTQPSALVIISGVHDTWVNSP
jgi:hypothetical protein